MDALVLVLGPAFVLALAIQQLTELIVGLIGSANVADAEKVRRKSVVLVLATALGAAAAWIYPSFRVIEAFSSATGAGTTVPLWLDSAITGLIVAGGTETLNSFLKFLGYTKEKKEAETDKLEAEAQLATAQTELAEVQKQAVLAG